MGNDICCLDHPSSLPNIQSRHRETWDLPILSGTNLGRFETQLAKIGFIVSPIAGDGNCLFRAIAHQLFGNDSRHLEVRQTCVDEMEQHPDSYLPFLADSEGGANRDAYFLYLRSMRRPQCWGGHLELVAASRAYDVNIIVHRLDHKPRCESNHGTLKVAKCIQLSYHNANHYASVCPVADNGGVQKRAAESLARVESICNL
jgi:hypothetical protein